MALWFMNVYDRYNYCQVEIADLGARKEHILSVTSPNGG